MILLFKAAPEVKMRRFNMGSILLCLILLVGCSKSPTSPNSSGWVQVTAHAPFAGRYGLSGAVFNNSMWVIGGASGNANASVTYWYNDVWSSSDGSHWTSVNGNAPFGGRFGSQVLSYNGKLWLIAGNQAGTFMNDVWNSSDGVSWTQVLANSPPNANHFAPREDFGAVVFNNQMVILGGTVNNSSYNDVWASSDGITWNQLSVGNFPARWGFGTVVFNNLLWIMDGATGTSPPARYFSDTWNSPDGINWNLVTNYVGPGELYFLQSVVNQGRIWKTGGYVYVGGGATNEVNNSPDGINWNPLSNPPFPDRFYHLSLTFNNQVWIIAGMDNFKVYNYYNDVWHGP